MFLGFSTPDFGGSARKEFRSMMQLLSASEKSALQSFLSVMDYPDDTLTASEWALLSSGTPVSSDNTFLVDPNSEHKEALAKATKDLMSLEPDRWGSQSALQNAVDGRADHNHHLRGFQQQQASMQHYQHFQQRRQMLNASFPFPQAKSQLQYPAMNGVQGPSSLQTSLTGMVQQLIDPSYGGLVGTPMGQSQSRSSSTSRHTLHPSSSNSSTTTASSSSHRVTRHSSSSKRKRKSTSPPSSATPSTTPTPKQTLLSPSQKKANHIQSEQKRRANIRRGYEALCETVPALREAIRQEEEEAAIIAEKNSAAGAGRRRRKKGPGQGNNGTGEEKDRIDGRAGPRSENVVLTKTIEHIQNLLADQSALLDRLHHAQSLLPLGHPASCPLQADPPWEREWKGGEGRAIGDEDVGSGSDGDDGDD